ncbi:uncharacterized protein [Anabrus simplex]|uniref:uncharacterized protein isoform X2 n=1 Tax=Anabrus simplex TaxID=316456 RepID=UPI0035A361F4
MSRGGGRNAKRPPDVGLLMECFEEDLTPCQASHYNKGEREYNEVMARVDSMIKSGGEIIEKGENVIVVQLSNASTPPVPSLNATTPTTGNAANSPVARQSTMIAQPSAASGPTMLQALPTPVILQGTTTSPSSVITRTGNTIHNQPGSYQLVMDPRVGLIVGTVTTAQQPSTGTPTPVIQTSASLPKTPVVSSSPQAGSRSTPQIRVSAPRTVQPPTPVTKQTNPAAAVPANQRQGSTNTNVRGKSKQQTSRPAENNSIGGLSTGGNKKNNQAAANAAAPIVDLTDDDPKANSSVSNHNVADSREVTFNKLSGKTFPSLVVVARPSLRTKDMPQSTVSQERAALDSKVKSVLMFTPTKFTEWLIQQGLVRSEQYCSTHFAADRSPVRLKLGMYSDVSKFPYSGGYVWISECCPQRFVSVFSGSIFEGAPHPPTVLLKLIYHWSCQTNVQNVVQWVKVDNFYVKNFYTNMRAVCTAAIHEKYEKMGGNRKRVEVGVISLGTTSQDGNMRQVKVEVLGVMDPENKLIRLRAVEPLQDGERNYKKRFVKILEPMDQWVERDSIILTDFTVDKGTLHNMGFNSVYQVSVTENQSSQNKYSNVNVMDYLRRIVPRMFQNTLSLLSRQIIQQFLDELVWRERFGPVPSLAFDMIIQHLAEQTKLETGENLLARLSKVSTNPFRNWNYANLKGDAAAAASAGSTPVQNGTTPAKGAKSPPSPVPATPKEASTAPVKAPSTPSNVKEPQKAEVPRGPISTIDMLPQSIRNVETPTPPPGSKRSGRKRALTDAVTPEPKRVAELPTPTVPEEQTALDSYYYGTLEGDKELIENEYKNTNSIKCCACQRKFTNNIQLMKHLILHAQKESHLSIELVDVTQCKYCLKIFPTSFLMQTHIEEIHLKTSLSLLCRICEEKFRDHASLIAHMHRLHVAMEMPYACGVCKFRSSMHRDVIDHFYEVHNNGETMQCPFCLKTVAFSHQGKRITANVYFFLTHMQKHQRRTITRKCTRCAMWFVHKGIQREHMLNDHTSYKGVPGVKVFVHPSGMDILMPVPPSTNGPSKSTLFPKKTSSIKLRTTYTTKPFESLVLNGVPTGSACCECEGSFLDEEHFPGYMTCNRCRYATCCSKAMAEHSVVFHDPGKAVVEFTMGRLVHLPKEMYCVCGFRAASGNRLAKHLANCERKSAYPTPAHAKASMIQSASFPPLVTLDDAENASEDPSDRWLKAFVPSRKDDSETSRELPEKKQAVQQERRDPPSMLNILGLVRKPSTDESSLDRAPSDNEGTVEAKLDEGTMDKEEVSESQKEEDKMDVDADEAKEEAELLKSESEENEMEGTGQTMDSEDEPQRPPSVPAMAVKEAEAVCEVPSTPSEAPTAPAADATNAVATAANDNHEIPPDSNESEEL